MRYGKMLLAVIVAAIVIGGAWMVMGTSNLSVVTKDVNYEASYEIVYADGSTVMVKRYKTASFQYSNKVVSHILFDLDAKFKATQTEDVRLMSPRAGGEFDTAVTFYVVDSIYGENLISEYPLSASTNTDYSVLDTGDWYNIFTDLKVSTSEIKEARGDDVGQKFDLKTVIDVWYNLDPEKSELTHHEIIFTVPFTILSITNEQPGPDGDGDGGIDNGGGGGGGGSGQIPDPTKVPIVPSPPEKPIIHVEDPIKIDYSLVPWKKTDNNDDDNQNLGKR